MEFHFLGGHPSTDLLSICASLNADDRREFWKSTTVLGFATMPWDHEYGTGVLIRPYQPATN